MRLQLGTNRWWAVHAALAQYVENGLCRDDVEDPHASDPLLAEAEATLAEMDDAIASLAA